MFSRIAIIMQLMNMLRYHPSLRIDVLTSNRKSSMPIGANDSGGTKIEESILLLRMLLANISIFQLILPFLALSVWGELVAPSPIMFRNSYAG